MISIDRTDGRTAVSPIAELRALGLMALPIALANLAEMAMMVTGLAGVGRLGETELAAVGFAGNMLWTWMFVTMGVLFSVGGLVAEAHGTGAVDAAARAARQGLVVAAVLSPIAMLGVWELGPGIAWLGQPPAVSNLASDYLRAFVWSVPAILWFIVLQRFVSGLFRPRVVTFILWGGVGLNVLAVQALVFGRFGMPALGVAGAGWAAVVVCWSELFVFIAAIAFDPRYRTYRLFAGPFDLHWPTLADILRIGWPIGAALALESSVFAAAGALVGRFGTAALAAHQIAISLSSISYMITMALSQAATYRVAHAAGADRPAAARQSGLIAIGAGACFMLASAIVIWIMPDVLSGFFLGTATVSNEETRMVARTLLRVLAIFQVADGVQCVAGGALRGIRDTRPALIGGFVGYWVIGLSLGCALAFPVGLGAVGIWWGLALGLWVVAVYLTVRFARLMNRTPAGEGPWRPR